ncbi:hypothetical protein ASZ90_011264 [hydrocarbon metagenome]|uniref:Uncharacterized protein n=1 Tax=hydrocarbon metagenome TaxID=938273 RepID=A0A0W8FDS3_9ZZZZ
MWRICSVITRVFPDSGQHELDAGDGNCFRRPGVEGHGIS